MQKKITLIKYSDIAYLAAIVLFVVFFSYLESTIPVVYPILLVAILFLININGRINQKGNQLLKKLAKEEHLKLVAQITSLTSISKKESSLLESGKKKHIKNYYKGKINNWTFEVYEYLAHADSENNHFHPNQSLHFIVFEIGQPKKDFGHFLIWHRREIHRLRAEYITDLETNIKGLKLHFSFIYGDNKRVNELFSHIPILDQIINQKMTLHFEGQGNTLRLYLPADLFNTKSLESTMHLIDKITSLV